MTGNGLGFDGVKPDEEPLPEIDTSVPHTARIYDYLLGAKDNFEADRKAATAVIQNPPHVPTAMRESRALMRRMAAYMAAETGLRQFLDIGTGLPTSPNVHEITQGIAPESRIVYVDNDPIVLAHARALLTSDPAGACTYIDADARDPEKILDHPRLRGTLDLTKPVGLMFIGILHFITSEEDPHAIVAPENEPVPRPSLSEAGAYAALARKP